MSTITGHTCHSGGTPRPASGLPARRRCLIARVMEGPSCCNGFPQNLDDHVVALHNVTEVRACPSCGAKYWVTFRCTTVGGRPACSVTAVERLEPPDPRRDGRRLTPRP